MGNKSAANRAIKSKVTMTKWGLFSKGQITPNTANYCIQMNAVPNISIEYSLSTSTAQNEAMRPQASTVVSLLGKQQTSAFEGKTTPDVSVDLTVDQESNAKEDSLHVDGYVCTSSVDVTTTSMTTSGVAMPKWAEMEALNYGIYSASTKNAAAFASGAKGDTFLDIIKDVEKKLFESWSEYQYEVLKKQDEHQAEQIKKIHLRNEKLRHYFQDILDASKQTVGWDKISEFLESQGSGGDYVTPAQSLRDSVAMLISQTLQTGASSFMGTLLQLGALFQWVFVPSYDSSKPGKFLNQAYAVGGKAEPLKLEIINFAGNVQNAFGLQPVSHITVKTPPNNNAAAYKRNMDVCAPKEAAEKGGAQIVIPPPMWWFPGRALVQKAAADKMASHPFGNMVSLGVEVYPDLNAQTQEAMKQTPQELEAAYLWALVMYAWSTLAGSTAQVQIPGRFHLELGKRYTVQRTEGETLFTGLLIGLNTTINKQTTLTSLMFSHIMFPGFKLPGEDELKSAGVIST